MSNANLHRAKKRKNDEFYTRFEDVEKELAHYPHAFEGKTVYCNCDDPFKSAFVKYFRENFDRLKLKRLIATCFNGDAGKGETMFLFPRTDDRVAWHFEKTADGETCDRLQYNGDFRSEECVALLRQCDVVVTNPPFSISWQLFRLLAKEQKHFIILGHAKFATLPSVLLAIAKGAIKVSDFNRTISFSRPDGEADEPINIAWYATLQSNRQPEPSNLTANFCRENYPTYDNYDAIEVSKSEDVPCDYDDVMGVPVTFLARWRPDEFEILGMDNRHACPALLHTGGKHGARLHGQPLYTRIFIRRKNFSCNCSNSLINSPQTERKSGSQKTHTSDRT